MFGKPLSGALDLEEMRAGTVMSDVRFSGSTHPARYWHRMEDGRIQCDLCPRFCRLREGQRGMCFVRARDGDRLVLTTYGRSSGFCVDPIEKKPLNHFYPGSPVLSFGTAGCNLACKFCQNWDISKSRQMDTLADSASPRRIARAARQLKCKSVAFTYNDPVIFLEYAGDVAAACREEGLQTVAVTAGYVCPEPRVEFFDHMDAANVDLKAFSEKFYWEVTKSHLEAVKETLEYICHETDTWVEITTLLIPGENDSDAELEQLSQWVGEKMTRDVPLHFTAFHPDFKMLDHPATPFATLNRARKIAVKAGLRYVYTGNVHDPSGQSTYCGSCGEIVIGRSGYTLHRWHLGRDGRCQTCGARCPGVFEDSPGTWGSRRLPVRLAEFDEQAVK